jgi:hypothetical protein
VSGISTLFSQEFYAHVRRHLKDDGVLVQWIQAYEINLPLLSTVFTALGSQMGDYAVYSTGPDLLVVATPPAGCPSPSDEVFRFPGMRDELARLGVRGVPDLEAMRVGSRFALEPLFDAERMPANSDYYPVLDQRAPAARFRRDHVGELTNVRYVIAPVMTFFDRDGRMPREHLVDPGFNRPVALGLAMEAAQIVDLAMGADPRKATLVTDPARSSAILVAALANDCGVRADAWLGRRARGRRGGDPFPARQGHAALLRLRAKGAVLEIRRCRKAPARGLLEAVNALDAKRVAMLAPAVLDHDGARFAEGERATYLGAAIAAALVAGDPARGPPHPGSTLAALGHRGARQHATAYRARAPGALRETPMSAPAMRQLPVASSLPCSPSPASPDSSTSPSGATTSSSSSARGVCADAGARDISWAEWRWAPGW